MAWIQAFDTATNSPKTVLSRSSLKVTQTTCRYRATFQASLGQLAFGNLAQTKKSRPSNGTGDGKDANVLEVRDETAVNGR